MTLISENFLFKNQNSSDVALIAQRLSKVLEIGDILLLKGPVGAGKSFCKMYNNEFFKNLKYMRTYPHHHLVLSKLTTTLNQSFVMFISNVIFK